MVIFYLQRIKVLPVLQEVGSPEKRILVVESVEYDCTYFRRFQPLYDMKRPGAAITANRSLVRKVPEFKDIGTNMDSVGKLLIGFFRFYLTDFDWESDVASIRTSAALSQEDKGWTNPQEQRNFLSVEDPFETDFNVARTLARNRVSDLRYEMLRAYFMLCNTRYDLQKHVLQEIQERVVGR